jgi:hypothetical protein
MLRINGASTNFLKFPGGGQWWSLIAGIVGAVGAFGVLLAFGAAPQPKAAYVPVVMSIIFAGAPIVNAFVSLLYNHGPKDSHVVIQWPFWVGIAMAAAGGSLVALYKPDMVPNHPPTIAAKPAPVEVVAPAKL